MNDSTNETPRLRIKPEDFYDFIAARLEEAEATGECQRLQKKLQFVQRRMLEAREKQLDLVEPVN
ncbi:MAG: hypothetical protein F4060_02345 [Holophagales bacterium]|nr:hypothetical protein [Holophagales bacterium]MYG31000.1 hypothetical protein [Holophagales bacterium]MYI78758.1 hypothetical protein [Holophagales bacterium]